MRSVAYSSWINLLCLPATGLLESLGCQRSPRAPPSCSRSLVFTTTQHRSWTLATGTQLSGSYHINNQDGLVTIKSAPEVNLKDSCSMATQVLSDPSFDPALPQLIDLRGMHNHMTYADEKQFRDFILTEYMPRVESSIAIVIDDELDSEILARLFHMSASMDKTELFDHYNQALKWLMRKEFANG